MMTPSYFADFVPYPDFNFMHLRDDLQWLEVTEARKEYFMSDVSRSYTYGKGDYAREYHSNPYSPIVERMQADLNETTHCQYNVCFLNRYDTQKHQLGWHADDSPSMDSNHPIAVISFGAEREIWWKLQSDKGVVPAQQRCKLEHGSLFVMPAGFQELYFHRIPKADREVGIRISLTFRRYKELS